MSAGADFRHVAEQNDGAVDVGRRRGQADPQRGRYSRPEVRIEGDCHGRAREGGLHGATGVADHYDDGPGARRERSLHDASDDRLPLERSR